VLFSRFDVVEPDLVYVSNARAAEVLTAAHVRGAPDLVVEIGSPSTRKRDETIKRRLYEGSGVAEYWAVDPDLDEIRVYRLTDGRFARRVLSCRSPTCSRSSTPDAVRPAPGTASRPSTS
jgi:Uma2 family endonuclease